MKNLKLEIGTFGGKVSRTRFEAFSMGALQSELISNRRRMYDHSRTMNFLRSVDQFIKKCQSRDELLKMATPLGDNVYEIENYNKDFKLTFTFNADCLHTPSTLLHDAVVGDYGSTQWRSSH